MVLNKNIFYATNPARILDALWRVMSDSGVDLSEMLIFLPSRRAVRAVEKMLAQKSGGGVVLPRLVPLGEGDNDEQADVTADEKNSSDDVISNTVRVIMLARLLAADACIKNIVTALPIARDLVRMTSYLENEGVDPSQIDFRTLIDEKYAAHFQRKADLLNILSRVMNEYGAEKVTETQRRNCEIRRWIDVLGDYKLVIVCGSTASVPATADLMVAIAEQKHGRIILSGKIAGRADDFELATNPYNCEYKFLERLGAEVADIIPIDVGASAIDFMNHAFGNSAKPFDDVGAVSHCHLIECDKEAEEATAVAEIAARSIANKKTVLVITPDAAGNQRIAAAMKARGIVADFSSGTPGTMTLPGRAIINLFNEWVDIGERAPFEKLYSDAGENLFELIVQLIENETPFSPGFDYSDKTTITILDAIKHLSDCVMELGLKLNLNDAQALLVDTISGVSVRPAMNDAADVLVLGTIESRMQMADVVILTGLNEGMFPAQGYENAWLPRNLAKQIGLPSPDRKVALQALDFMNLSCGGEVYWLRSLNSGGVKTMQSRFLSRVMAYKGACDTKDSVKEILAAVRARDDVPYCPLDDSAPTPPADWSDVFVTELELLIHNPYAFYVRHILRLRVLDDYWAAPDARDFGNLVHSVVENARDFNPNSLLAEMDRLAREKLGDKSILFHFWHRRFMEIAPVIANELTAIENASAEISGGINIAGRNIRARADRVWDGGVLDIKTGTAPNKSQLSQGNMPQLPLEAYILQNGGFPINTTYRSQTPVIKFLQLKSGDARVITYEGDAATEMINAAVAKTTELVNMYSAGGAAYEYHDTNDQKYQMYDDLARKN